MRQLLAVCVAIVLVARCGKTPTRRHATEGSGIRVVEWIGSPENCGLIYHVRPVYPRAARNARGLVKLWVWIGKTGEVGKIETLSGDPLLVPAAVDAVKQWRYAPCRVNGEAIPVKVGVDVPFTLNQ